MKIVFENKPKGKIPVMWLLDINTPGGINYESFSGWANFTLGESWSL